MLETKPRTYFFRPSHPAQEVITLNPVLVRANALKGIETTIVLDTNILIAMERVVKGGNKNSLLKQNGLHNFIKFLNHCPSICIAPGMAFQEMPPALAEKSRWHYEAFCAKHLSSFADTPNCIQPIFNEKDTGHGYLDLDPEVQGFLAIPFCALLYLNIIDKKPSDGPIQKFKEYLRKLNDDLDILSTKEIEIAKYCFAEPPATAIETIRIRKLLRRNFLKTKKDKAVNLFNEAMAVAFNGACDLSFINFGNTSQGRELHKAPQDCWIATCDKKLFEFSQIAHYVNLDGDAGKFFKPTILPEHSHDIYWQQANLSHQSLLSSRPEYRQVDETNISSLVGKAKAAIEEAALAFPEA